MTKCIPVEPYLVCVRVLNEKKELQGLAWLVNYSTYENYHELSGI